MIGNDVPLSPFPQSGVIPSDWTDLLGPLTVVGSHQGVVVMRLVQARQDGLRFVKVHREENRGNMEVSLLRNPPPGVVVPDLLLLARQNGQVVIGLSDVREGRDKRLESVDVDMVVQATRLLAKVHSHVVDVHSTPVQRLESFVKRAKDFSVVHDLGPAFEALAPTGDCLVHGDLHPTNWIVRDGVVEGFLDWAGAGVGDPEEDLAGLAMACDGAPGTLLTACSTWQDATGRRADVPRALLYLRLLLADTVGRLGDTSYTRCFVVALESWASAVAELQIDQFDSAQSGLSVPTDDLSWPWALGATVGQPVPVKTPFYGTSLLEVDRGLENLWVRVQLESPSASAVAVETWLYRRLRGTSAAVLEPIDSIAKGPLFRAGSGVARAFKSPLGAVVDLSPAVVLDVARAMAALHEIDVSEDPCRGLSPRLLSPLPVIDAWLASSSLGAEDRADLSVVRDWIAESLAEAANSDLPRVLSGPFDHNGPWYRLGERGPILLKAGDIGRGLRVADIARLCLIGSRAKPNSRWDLTRLILTFGAYRERVVVTSREIELVPVFLACQLLVTIGSTETPSLADVWILLNLHENRGDLAKTLSEVKGRNAG